MTTAAANFCTPDDVVAQGYAKFVANSFYRLRANMMGTGVPEKCIVKQLELFAKLLTMVDDAIVLDSYRHWHTEGGIGCGCPVYTTPTEVVEFRTKRDELAKKVQELVQNVVLLSMYCNRLILKKNSE